MTDKKIDLVWHTEERIINDLIPFELNPRQISDEQKKNLTKSIVKFNLVEIPAIDLDNKIIAGHQRLNIMKLIGRGEEKTDVRVPNRKLTDEEFKEYNVRSNKNTGDWDMDILLNSFDVESLKDWGFSEKELSINNFGSDNKEINMGELGDDLNIECPKCHFRFKKDEL